MAWKDSGISGTVLGRGYNGAVQFTSDELTLASEGGFGNTRTGSFLGTAIDFVGYLHERGINENLAGAQDFTSNLIENGANYYNSHSANQLAFGLGNFTGEQAPAFILTAGSGTVLKVGGELVSAGRATEELTALNAATRVGALTDRVAAEAGVATNSATAGGSVAGGGMGDIAFGLSRHQETGARDLLSNFANNVGAKTYADFYDRRIFPTESMLEKLMYGGDRLHVNLDGLLESPAQLPNVVQMGSRGLDFVPLEGGGNITNWEVWRLHQDPALLNKTTFYFDGAPISK